MSDAEAQPPGPRWVSWPLLIGVYLLLLLVLALHHIVGFGRDDLVVTEQIGGTSLAYTAPQWTYAEGKVYQLFIHSRADQVTAPGSSQTATETVRVTVSEAAGVFLRTEPGLGLPFRAGVYQTATLSYSNAFTSTKLFIPDSGIVTVTIASGASIQSLPLRLRLEPGAMTLVRRLVWQPLGAVFLTIVAPAMIVVWRWNAARRAKERAEQRQERVARAQATLHDLERQVRQLTASSTLRRDSGVVKQLGDAIASLATEAELLSHGQLTRLAEVQNSYQFSRVLSALRLGEQGEAKALLADLEPAEQFVDERHRAAVNELIRLGRESWDATTPLLEPGVPYLEERLLMVQQQLDRLTAGRVAQLVEAHRRGELHIEADMVATLHQRDQLAGVELPVQIKVDDRVYLAPLGLAVDYYELEPRPSLCLSRPFEHPTIAVAGPPGSGKTATLHFLQNHLRQPGVIYLEPLPAAALLGQGALGTVGAALARALLELLAEHPDLWAYLRDQGESTRQALERLGDSAARQGEGANAAVLILVQLDRLLAALRIDILCLAIDDAPEGFNSFGLRRELEACLSKRIVGRTIVEPKVMLRIASGDPGFESRPGESTLTLTWHEEQLRGLLKSIDQVAPDYWRLRWDAEELEWIFWSVVRSPRDLLVWLAALRGCYPGQYLTVAQWVRLYNVMDDARKRRGAVDEGWLIEDWYTARQKLGS